MLANLAPLTRRSSDLGPRSFLRAPQTIPPASNAILDRFEATRRPLQQPTAVPLPRVTRPAIEEYAVAATFDAWLIQGVCQALIATGVTLGVIAGAFAIVSTWGVATVLMHCLSQHLWSAAREPGWVRVWHQIILIIYAQIATVTSLAAAYCAYEVQTFQTLLRELKASLGPQADPGAYEQARDAMATAALRRTLGWGGAAGVAAGVWANPMLLVSPFFIVPAAAFGALAWVSRH